MRLIRKLKWKKERGVALLIVLVALALLSVLVLGFLSSMTTEVGVSNAVEETHRTKLLADGALAHSIDLLRSNIPDPEPLSKAAAASPKNWVSNPGRLTIIEGSGRKSFVDLHSGEAPTPSNDEPPDARSVDLNRPVPGNSVGPIAMLDNEKRPKMRVAWIPVLADPSRPADRDNRMTGRYAFWIDDESTKINISVALGKPAPQGKGDWKTQLAAGFPTPRLRPAENRDGMISLGHPSSINADVLFEKPGDIDIGKLYDHAFVHGFHRFPDSVLRYTELKGNDARDWLINKRWYFSFYSRAPEFNAFGGSRFFSMFDPSSLDAGPAYQMPFTSGGDAHFHGFLSSPAFGFDSAQSTAEQLEDLNEMNLAVGGRLYEYLKQRWPGYASKGSFEKKYGDKEARQMVLNIMLMSRLATVPISQDPGQFPHHYARLVTSANYLEKDKQDGKVPEQDYWRISKTGFKHADSEPPMLPQTPGPHLNEVKFVVIPEEFFNDEGQRRYRLQYRYEVEYYMHPLGPTLLENPFPAKVDYLRMEAGDAEQEFDDDSWDSKNLRKLIARPDAPIGPTSTEGDLAQNYRVASSKSYYLTDSEDGVGEGTPVEFDPALDGKIDFEVDLRLGLAGPGPRCKEVVPLGTDNQTDVLHAELEIDLTFPDPDYSVSWEVEDPRVSRMKDDWALGDPGKDTMGAPNSNQPQAHDAKEYANFKSIQLADSATIVEEAPLSVTADMRTGGRLPSNGYWSMIHTGIQSSEPWKTLSLAANQQDLPDWLLIDLMGVSYPMPRSQWVAARSLPDTWSSLSYLNATAGKMNLNNRVYPDGNSQFQPPDRTISMVAAFKHFRPQEQIETFAENILNYQSKTEVFDYVGELADVPGYEEGANDWEKETLLRNMAGALTTQSNTFGVWGIAQTVRKQSAGQFKMTFGVEPIPDEFEEGDAVRGERRFYALVERYVWPGKDGVPGNGHTTSNGHWDRLAKGSTGPGSGGGSPRDDERQVPGSPPRPPGPESKFAEIDGPTEAGMDFSEILPEVPYRRSSLENAYNPADPVIKYRILYYKYLDH